MSDIPERFGTAAGVRWPDREMASGLIDKPFDPGREVDADTLQFFRVNAVAQAGDPIDWDKLARYIAHVMRESHKAGRAAVIDYICR